MSKIAFIFPGQGSQYVGMGRELVNAYPELLSFFQEAEGLLDFDLKELCFTGPEDELKKTSNTQPAILTVSLMCYQLLQKSGISPDFVAGHSLGEYSALVAAESIAFTDALRLVRQRGLLMEEAYPLGTGSMAAVLGLDSATIEKSCQQVLETGFVEIANYNCPGQIVISGEKIAIRKAAELLKEAGAKRIIELAVSGPFHSQLMKDASNKFAKLLEKVSIKNPAVPVIANVSADYLSGWQEIRDLLVKQLYSPIRWEESMKKLYEDGVRIFIELGPGKVLSGLVKKTVPGVTILNVEDPISLEKTLAKLKECR